MATRFTEDLRSQFLQQDFQQRLSHWNRLRLAPQFPDDWREDNAMLRLEHGFIEELRAEVRAHAAQAPTDPDGFVDWFEQLKEDGPGQNDPLFPWLAETASRDELRWFLTQEAAGEAGFDDLVALTQVKLPAQAKLELARNYWDEMGRGNMKGMHGPMLAQLVDVLDLDPTIEGTVWESLALANAMTAMATSRAYAWHSVGALGVIELTAPGRSKHTAAGLRRIGLTQSERRYFDLHAVLDIKHSRDWNDEAIRPLVAEDPRRATAMAEGALMRLRCGERCFARYRAHFGLGAPDAMARPSPVLLIEDDTRLAGRIMGQLHRADVDIDGPYATVSDAVAALADHFPDVAIVDLHREDAGLLIDDLESYDIPFLLCPHDGEQRPGGRSLLIGEDDLDSPTLPNLLALLREGRSALH